MAIILQFPRLAAARPGAASGHGDEIASSAEIVIFTGSRARAAKPQRPRGLRPFFPALFPLLMLPLNVAPLEEI